VDGDGLVLGAAVPEAERDLDAVGGDAQRDDAAAALELDPVEHQHGQSDVLKGAGHQRVEVLAGAAHELARHAGLRGRPLGLDDLLADRLTRAREPAGRDAGQHLLEHRPRQRVAVGEVRIGRQRHLGRPVDRAHPRPRDPNAPATERDLAGLVAVTNRDAAGVALALRANNITNFFLHQLGQHAEPDADAQRQQPVLRGPDQLAQRLLHRRRQRQLPTGVLLLLYGAHGGSSCPRGLGWRLSRSQRERTRREDRHFKFYEPRDNLP